MQVWSSKAWILDKQLWHLWTWQVPNEIVLETLGMSRGSRWFPGPGARSRSLDLPRNQRSWEDDEGEADIVLEELAFACVSLLPPVDPPPPGLAIQPLRVLGFIVRRDLVSYM